MNDASPALVALSPTEFPAQPQEWPSEPAPRPAPPPRRPRRWLPPSLLVLTAAAVGGLFVLGWQPRARQQAALLADSRRGAEALPRVRVALPRPGPVATPLRLPGTVQAARTTAIHARIGGYVKRWLVDLGEPVAAGQLLAELDAPEVEQELAQAVAQSALSQAGIEQARAALALGVSSLERVKSLGPQITNQQEIDNRQGAHDVALADLHMAEAKAQGDAADVQRLRQLLGFTRVVAPFAGTITARTIEIGNLVTAGGGSEPLFELAQVEPLKVVVEVPQAAATTIASGLAAKIAIPGGGEVAGSVAHLARALDPTSRTMQVEVAVPKPGGALLPGQYVQVVLSAPVSRPQLLISAEALITGGKAPQVAVIDATGHVHLVTVAVDNDTGADLAIGSGLAAGDRVVQNPDARLVEGIAVEVVVAPPAAPAAAAATATATPAPGTAPAPAAPPAAAANAGGPPPAKPAAAIP